MSVNEKDSNGASEPSSHENKLSQLYRDSQDLEAEIPSPTIDSEILAIAKKQLANTSTVLTAEQLVVSSNIKQKKRRAWRRPLSLAASVGFVSVLFVTQYDYFTQPYSEEVEDVTSMSVPTLDPSETIISQPPPEKPADRYYKKVQLRQVEEVLEELASQPKPADAKSTALSPRIENSTLTQLEGVKSELVLTATPKMTLTEMTELAESLNRQFATLNGAQLKASGPLLNRQQTLFEHLLEYQKRHPSFRIPDNFLQVLTMQQKQQLLQAKTDTIETN